MTEWAENHINHVNPASGTTMSSITFSVTVIIVVIMVAIMMVIMMVVTMVAYTVWGFRCSSLYRVWYGRRPVIEKEGSLLKLVGGSYFFYSHTAPK